QVRAGRRRGSLCALCRILRPAHLASPAGLSEPRSARRGAGSSDPSSRCPLWTTLQLSHHSSTLPADRSAADSLRAAVRRQDWRRGFYLAGTLIVARCTAVLYVGERTRTARPIARGTDRPLSDHRD